MIISASRRTDIPSYFSKWFLNRLREGYLSVRNPYNYNQVSRIDLNKEVIDGIVFWTKDPSPLMKNLEELDSYGIPYYFQFTITPYGKLIEPKVRSKSEIMETFKVLSSYVGKDKIIWRYDPIFLYGENDINWNLQMFENYCKELSPFTEDVVISIMDEYSSVMKRFRNNGIICHNFDFEYFKEYLKIAKNHNLRISTCSEKVPKEIRNLGLGISHCIDIAKFQTDEFRLDLEKDEFQREECGCYKSIDIGVYSTCHHGCLYCYASKGILKRNHNPKSSFLIGESEDSDRVKIKSLSSNKIPYKMVEVKE